MRHLLRIAVSIAILFLSACACAQSAGTNADSSTISTAPAGVADDPAFAAFQPVTSSIRPPKATSAPDPKFPNLPPDAEPRGTVVLLIGVNTKGRVEAVRVLRSDEAAFEKSAVATVKRWKFKPAEKDGRPVPVQVTVEMKFQK
jgi:periplasmic protein TonB